MSHAGYNIMHIVHTWVKTEMVKMKNEKANLTDIDFKCEEDIISLKYLAFVL